MMKLAATKMVTVAGVAALLLIAGSYQVTASVIDSSIPSEDSLTVGGSILRAIGVLVSIAIGFGVLKMLHGKFNSAGPQVHLLPNNMFIYNLSQLETLFLYDEIFIKDAYASGEIKLNPGDTIIDAGANIGMFSLWVNQQCKGTADIYSFEPIPTTYEILERNARCYGNGRIHTFHKGLSDKEQNVMFEHHSHISIWSTSSKALAEGRIGRVTKEIAQSVSGGTSILSYLPKWLTLLASSLIMKYYSKTEQVECELVKLGDVIEEQGIQKIDLLKADVEGAEFSVLQGVYDHQWPMVQQVALELESLEDVYQVRDFLRGKGFNVYWTAATHIPGNDASELSMLYAKRESCSSLSVDTEGYILVDKPTEEESEGKRHR